MEQGKLDFKGDDSHFVLEKDGQKISIWQTVDNDVWFGTKSDEVCIELRDARDFKERALHRDFKEFMKSVIGRYLLEDSDMEFSNLPSDFIDLKNKTIIWHSDNGNDNLLKIVYDDNVVRIYIIRGAKSKSTDTIVRVRTDGSDYMYYYQEFLNLFNEIKQINFIYGVMKDANINLDYSKEDGGKQEEVPIAPPVKEVEKPRVLSLRRIFKRHEKNDSK